MSFGEVLIIMLMIALFAIGGYLCGFMDGHNQGIKEWKGPGR